MYYYKTFIFNRSGSSNGNRGGRRGRSVEDEHNQIKDAILQASILDSDDCAKNFVCQLNTIPVDMMTEMEREVYKTFSSTSLDVSQDSVEFDLAAIMGRLAGVEQCKRIYKRCASMEYSQMISVVESTF